MCKKKSFISQLDIPSRAISSNGCLFMSYLYIYKMVKSLEITIKDVLYWYDKFTAQGVMTKSCYILDNNAVQIILDIDGDTSYSIGKRIFNKNPSSTHFVVLNGTGTEIVYDPDERLNTTVEDINEMRTL